MFALVRQGLIKESSLTMKPGPLYYGSRYFDKNVKNAMK